VVVLLEMDAEAACFGRRNAARLTFLVLSAGVSEQMIQNTMCVAIFSV
jgi:tagatose-1,6-bisphosphate aldolase